VAKPTRRSRDYSPEEIAWLTDPGESVAQVMAPPPSESYGAGTVSVPVWDPPSWVRGVLSEALIRQAGWGDQPPPVPEPRRLVVVDDEGEHRFEFDPQLGGQVVVWGAGRGPDARGEGDGCLGKFSPFGTVSMRLEDDSRIGVKKLVVVERALSEHIERVIPIDPLAPPSLFVEVVRPDPREPWVMRTDTTSFALAKVVSVALEDAD
jgi:hypothetical protein